MWRQPGLQGTGNWETPTGVSVSDGRSPEDGAATTQGNIIEATILQSTLRKVGVRVVLFVKLRHRLTVVTLQGIRRHNEFSDVFSGIRSDRITTNRFQCQ